MKRIAIIIVFISLNSMVIAAKNQNKIDITGYWAKYFPAMMTSGYLFCENNKFYFVDNSDENINYKYSGSIGLWKIDKGTVLIKILYDATWKNKFIIGQTGHYYPGENNEVLYRKHNNPQWEIIGYLNTYSDYSKRKNFPETISLKPLINAKPFNKALQLFRLCSICNDNKCLAAKDMKELFQSIDNKLE